MFASRGFRLASLLACVVMVFSMISIDQAEARRGGSFGSRGTRTFQTAPATNTSPTVTGPVERSMTPAPQATGAPRTGAQQTQQRGPLGGFGGPLLTGLMFGGLLGMMFGQGFGGMAGLFGLLVQVVLAVFVIRWLMRRFSGSTPRTAMAGAGMGTGGYGDMPMGSQGASAARPAPRNRDELGIKPDDLDRFEAMLTQVQEAFGREDYGALRELTTPEMMSYLSEELGENASRGIKNEVSQIKLMSGDVAESWREGNADYATAALRYAALDVTRERDSGRVVEGDETQASQTTELWTFVRRDRGAWKLSAIQQA